ncbi:MAG: hypothetical protein GKS03_13565 [Alphaproteobacteria bacterium]|nr:hypothetical protein [Alphaproteobacteria bacterium]
MESLDLSQDSDGSTMVCAPFPAQDLPPVGLSDIRRAWETASKAAEMGLELRENDPDGVVFQDKLGAPVQVKFDDFDAHCWATAIHRSFNLATVKGLSVCFRMLALYQLMAKSPWARPLFSFDRKNGLRIDKGLLAAAAPLNVDGLFDSENIREETGAPGAIQSH